MDSAQTNEVNARLIGTLVQASHPPEYFSHDLVRVIGPLFENSGQVISGQTIFEDRRERILTLRRLDGDADVSGVLFLSRKRLNPIFYEYAVKGDMAKPVRDYLNERWTDCTEHWIECMTELSGISRFAMGIAPIEVNETTENMTEDLTFSLESSELYRGSPIRIEFEQRFIETLYGLPPSERGAKILFAGQEAIINQL